MGTAAEKMEAEEVEETSAPEIEMKDGIPLVIRETLLGDLLYRTMRNMPDDDSGRVQQITKDLYEKFDKNLCPYVLLDFLWEKCLRPLDLDAEDLRYLMYGAESCAISATHMRVDMQTLQRDAVARGSEKMMKWGEVLGQTSIMAALMGQGRSSRDSAVVGIISVISKILPDINYEVLYMLPSWNARSDRYGERPARYRSTLASVT